MIGLYGGTFDPIHNGHLHVAKQLLKSGRISKVILIPAGEPRLKIAPQASGEDRIEMCRLAIADSSKKITLPIEVSDVEIKRSGPSYAIDTVTDLMKLYPEEDFAWIIGSDAFRKIDEWHESARLQELIAFIVIERPNPENRNNSNESGEIDDTEEFDSLDIDALSISSTDIRGRLARGERVDALLSPSVSEFIRENGLYASA